jgi:hypothetical protein
MSSEVDICNIALAKLGVDTITSFGDKDDKGSIICNAVYPTLVQELLRLYPWNFALEKAMLALRSSAPLFGYAYSYALPGDSMKVISLEEETDQFKKVGNTLETDTENAKITYVKDITDPVLFDSTFVMLLAARITSVIGFAMTGKEELIPVFERQYALSLKSVIDVDASEGKEDPNEDNTIADSRL